MLFFLLLFFCITIIMVINRNVINGWQSERALSCKIKFIKLYYGGKTLTNLYVPKLSGGTTEIDLVYITRKGILVIENKNYAGYIFGNEKNKNWTVTLYAGKSFLGRNRVEKHHFYNPIWQNDTHIRHLMDYLDMDLPIFSLVTFGNRGKLKNISIDSPGIYVCNHSRFSKTLRKIWEIAPEVLSEEEINYIYSELLPLTKSTFLERREHVKNIYSPKTSDVLICPECNGQLILRTAKKGQYIGNQFYGCSNYPYCRYMQSIYT